MMPGLLVHAPCFEEHINSYLFAAVLDCAIMAGFSDETVGKWRNHSLKICWKNLLGRGRGYFKGLQREERLVSQRNGKKVFVS